MSSPDAIATVTATLRHLLSGLTATVTTQPPSTARNAGNGDQINIFLYSTYYNTAFTNMPLPGDTQNSARNYPPLPLVLKYLITTYGANDDDIAGQQLIGRVMSLLHDHSLLGRDDIEGITPNSNLHQQVERVRITPDALSLDDMSKLWSSFQTAEYRISTGYEVSVVLIESTRASVAPLPVLRRGANDRGPAVLVGAPPALSGLRFANQQPGAQLGDRVTLLGERLSHHNTVLRFRHPRLDDAITLALQMSQSNTEMDVLLPSVADDATVGFHWPAGNYALSLLKQQPDTPVWTSNTIAMQLVPRIEVIDPTVASAGTVELTIECLPQVKEGQRVALLFGDQTVMPNTVTTAVDPTARTILTFTIENATAKTLPYVLRLRVDGVDSIPVDFSGETPQFASDQQVIINE